MAKDQSPSGRRLFAFRPDALLTALVAFFLPLSTCDAGADEQREAGSRREDSASRGTVLEGAEAMQMAIRLARVAMDEHDFRRSREILQRVVNAPQFPDLPPEDRVAALFALGQTHDGLGDHHAAVRVYRRILADHPGLVRVRLELARSFFLLGEDTVADYHFRFVLAGQLPEAVETNVRSYLWQIRLRRKWSSEVGASVVGSTNVNAAPTIRQIEMFGMPFELDDDARAKSGIGFRTFAGGEYRQPLSETVRLRVGASVDNSIYSDSKFNDTIAGAHIGPHLRFDGGRLGEAGASLLLQGFRRWFGKEKFSRGIGPALEFTFEPADRFRLATRLDQLHLRYDDQKDLDGTLTSATLRPSLILSPTSYATLTLGAAYDRTDYDRLRNWQYRIGFGYHKDLSHGFTFGIQPEYRYVRYERDWPNFGERRRDHLFSFRADLLNRRLDLWGFTPVVGYRYQNRSSTIDLYDFDQHRGEISLTRHF